MPPVKISPPEWNPKRSIYPLQDGEIAWDDGPAYGAIAGDRVIFTGYHQDLVSYAEYEVWVVDGDLVELVRTDRQNFTYDRCTVTVNHDEIYWINSY